MVKVKVDKLFFELLQTAVGNREELSRVPTVKEWLDLYDESERQSVTGVMVAGLEKLKANTNDTDYTNNLPLEQLLQWIGVGQIIEQQNHVMDERCLELLQKLKENGLNGSILKGQAIALSYDKNMRSLRQSGDIDVFVDCGFRKALAFAKTIGQNDVKWDYKHLHLNLWDDTEVEMHYHVEVLLNLWKNRRLQKWFKEHEDAVFGTSKESENSNKSRIGEGLARRPEGESQFENNKLNTDGTNHTDYCLAEIKERAEIVTPTLEFNVFYILLHIYRHFLYEGVGMRQIIDYYFVLKNLDDNVDLNSNRTNFATDAVKEFGMERFVKGLMWVMQESLGMPRKWMLWEPDGKEGKFILDEIMSGGNFGHHDERLQHGGSKWNTVKQVCRHNCHLLWHYPADVIWAPIWFVWHKCWKVFHS